MSFIYKDNQQIRSEIKKTAIDHDIPLSKIANICGITPQQLNNRFNNKRLSLSDLSAWCDAMDCDLVIDIVPRDTDGHGTDME